MFYSHTILARKSPLGTVWIAAHLERKIKKPQIDGIDIPTYAESIMFPEVPIALRLSGHLLLGLVRIYSWKVNYLLQDCNRMVTTIRTAFASVQVDLPFESDRVRSEAITLPSTFNLDDLNLDDAICQINTPDNHWKTPDEITLPDGGEYVMIDLDEDVSVEPSAPGLSSLMGPKPIQDETLPPFGDGFGENDIPNNEIPPPGKLPVNSNTKDQTDGKQDPPEKMREASQEPPGMDIDFIIGNDDPMDVNQDSSPFVQNKVITPPVAEISSTDPQTPGRSIRNLRASPTTYGAFDDGTPLTFGNELPELRMDPSPSRPQPSPPQARSRRPKAQDDKGKRKRRLKFDDEIVLSNEYMKKQISDAEQDKLKRKRRKLPQTALNLWRFSRTSRKDSFFLEPLLHGMCADLHGTYERNFRRVSDPDPESAASEPMAGESNGGGQEPPPERQLTPKSRGNDDAPPEHQIPSSPKSPGNVGAHPQPLSTPRSPGADAARYDDMLPELPRFSLVDMPSPIREDDSPFKTPSTRAPQSELGGTGGTEIPPSDGSYLFPGQNTRDSMASLFPINEDDYDQPEFPGLMSTPGVTSSASTGVTGLGSMSTRTRAVAQFFKDRMPSTSSDEQPGKFSLNGILEGKTRKQAARMFFETTVLKSYDYIDVQQEPYGDIEISVKPGAKL